MKYNFCFLFVFFFSCQNQIENFELSEPDMIKIEQRSVELNDLGEYFYAYLDLNYQKDGQPFEKKFYEFNSVSTCGFKQNFQYGIQYKYESCDESGIEVEIKFPKLGLSLLRSLIEKLNDINIPESYEEEYHWIKSDLEYQPVEAAAGCYYIIDDSENDKTKLSFYCGC